MRELTDTQMNDLEATKPRTFSTDQEAVIRAHTHCKYDATCKSEHYKACDWCGDNLCEMCGYNVEDERACNECYKEISECEHMCTSNCRREGCNCNCGNSHKSV